MLNPLVEALRQEQLLLGRGDLSWRAYSRSCEYIRPVGHYLDFSQLPNLEDFLADPSNPGFAHNFDAHDRAVQEVESKANQFFDRLMNSKLFLDQVRDLVQGFHAARPVPMTIPQGDLPKYVAEYLINNTENVPAHYVTHEFWAQNRAKFPHLAEDFKPYKQRESFQNLQVAVGKLRGVSESILNRLEEHRRYLCISFDIPAAPWTDERARGA